MRRWNNQYLRAAVASLLAAAIAFGVAKLNIASSDTTSDLFSDAVVQRVTAPFYGSRRLGQDRISVVYLDDLEIPALKATPGWQDWPPSFGDYARIIDNLVGGYQAPQALFVDFVFTGETVRAEDAPACVKGTAAAFAPQCGYWRLLDVLRDATRADLWAGISACHDTPLMQIACTVAAGGMPVFLARSSPDEVPLWNDRQRELARMAVFVPALVDVNAYPLADDHQDGRFLAGRAEALPRLEAIGVAGYDLSPAAGLYAAACMTTPGDCQEPAFRQALAMARLALAGKAAASPPWPVHFLRPVSVRWGSRAPDGQQAATRAVTGAPLDCLLADPRASDAVLRQLASRAVGELFPDPRDRSRECLYAFNLSYAALAGGHAVGEATANRLLAQKLVLLGARYRASNDWVASPVHNQVPGVYIHAMATDNLLEDGLRYRRSFAPARDPSDLLETGLVFSLAFMGFAGAIQRNRLVSRHGLPDGSLPLRRAAGIYVAVTVTSLVAIVLVTILGVTLLHIAPINWLGVAGVSLTYALFALRNSLREDVGGWLSRHRATAWIPATTRAVLAWLNVETPPAPPAPRPPRRSHPKARSRSGNSRKKVSP